MKESFGRKLVMSRITLAELVERKEGERLTTRAHELRMERRRRRGRPRLKWEDYSKKHLASSVAILSERILETCVGDGCENGIND